MDPNVKDKILSRPRAKELAAIEPPEPSIHEVRNQIGGPGVSDEELLLRWVVHREDIEAMRKAGPIQEYLTAAHPLIVLLQELLEHTESREISLQKPGLKLVLRQGRRHQQIAESR